MYSHKCPAHVPGFEPREHPPPFAKYKKKVTTSIDQDDSAQSRFANFFHVEKERKKKRKSRSIQNSTKVTPEGKEKGLGYLSEASPCLSKAKTHPRQTPIAVQKTATTNTILPPNIDVVLFSSSAVCLQLKTLRIISTM